MPFTYDVTLERNDLREDIILLDGWADDVWDSYVKEGQVFAYAHDSQGKIKLLTNGDAYLSTKIAKVGQEIGPNDRIAVFAADGENIPYRRPYCILEYQ